MTTAVAPSSAERTTVGAGVAFLDVRREAGRSVVTRAFASSPLKLLTPTNHGHAAWIYVATYGGGLVDGDALTMDVSIGPDAAALLSTQASTKVFRSPRGTSMETTARVAPGGLLAVLPDPVVCFASARYRQIQQFTLERDANLVLVDWMSSGRRARGERWAFEEYQSRLSIRAEEKIVVYDALTLRAADGDLSARLERFNVLAVVVAIGPRVRSAAARMMDAAMDRRPARRPDCLIGAAPIGALGALVRVAGVSVEDVGRALRQWLGFLPTAIGDDPWTRKW